MSDPPAPTENQAPPADFYAAAVYGSIVAASLIGAFRAEHVSSESLAFALLSTLLVFWAAHVWSAIVGERISLGIHFTVRHGAEIARSEWPLIEAAFAPTVILLLGWAGALGDRSAETAALVICILQLFVWGLVVGHRAYDTIWKVVGAGLGNALLGVVLVVLEIAVVN